MTRTTKKQYQPSITTYLHRTGQNELASGFQILESPERASGVSLPEHVQASLISVGMRVRKAVPEGYKTKISGDDTPHVPEGVLKESLGNKGARSSYSRELLPFCGLHKVGGHSMQPQQGYNSFYPPTDWGMDSEMDAGFPESSQESFATSVSTDSVKYLPNDKKRPFEEDAQDYDCGFYVTSEGFPLFSFAGRQSIIAQRPIARAVARRKGATRIVQRAVDIRSEEIDDFEDAEFLQPCLGGAMEE